MTSIRRGLITSGLCVAVSLMAVADAREFRQLRPIATPDRNLAADGSRFDIPRMAISPETVEAGLRWVLEDWRSRAMSEHLGNQLYDRERLLDVLDTAVPRDAKLRLLAMRDYQVLGQRVERNAQGQPLTLVSQVNVVAETQVEFNAPGAGFQRIEGTNEFLLELTESFE